MRKYRGGIILLAAGLALIFSASCSQKVDSPSQNGHESKTTVTLGAGSETGVTSYQATVKVFYENSRVAGSNQLAQSYKLSTKIIDGSLYSRIDYDADPSLNLSKRSVICGPTGSVIFNPDTGAVSQRVAARENGAEKMDMNGKFLCARIDVASLKQNMRSLGYDVTDEVTAEKENVVCFTASGALLPKSPISGHTTTAFKMLLDTDNGTLAGSEMVETQADGTIITTTVTKYYQEENGIMIPVGEKTVINHDLPGSIEVNDSAYPGITNVEALPKLTQSEFESMKADGQAYAVPEAVAGDPTNPDYIETWVTAYDTVNTNTLEDSLFKIAGVN